MCLMLLFPCGNYERSISDVWLTLIRMDGRKWAVLLKIVVKPSCNQTTPPLPFGMLNWTQIERKRTQVQS